jgi:large subunit ribosomal protein L28
MAMCELCGKTRSFGHNVSHSKRRTNRDWLPNVQQKTLLFEGRIQRLSVCARCLRTLTKPARMATRVGA